MGSQLWEYKSLGGKFIDAVAQFSTTLVGKQITSGIFYVRNLARGKREKKG